MRPAEVSDPPSSSRFQRFVRIILYVAMGFLLMTGVVFFYWSVQSSEVLIVKNSPLPVRPDINQPDNAEVLSVDYCKKIERQGKVTLRLVGQKSIIDIPWPNDESKPGCLKVDLPVIIPTYAIDDTYYFDFLVSYKINPIKTQNVMFKSQSFVVQSE